MDIFRTDLASLAQLRAKFVDPIGDLWHVRQLGCIVGCPWSVTVSSEHVSGRERRHRGDFHRKPLAFSIFERRHAVGAILRPESTHFRITMQESHRKPTQRDPKRTNLKYCKTDSAALPQFADGTAASKTRKSFPLPCVGHQRSAWARRAPTFQC